jgi:CubicO group peptidase (beta-lactamase class C family)
VRNRRAIGLAFAVIGAGGLALSAAARPPDGAVEERRLVGLWRARRFFGPEIRGPLTIERDGEAWRAEIAGRAAMATLRADRYSFELPDGEGAFRGRRVKDRIVGHWIQPRTVSGGGYPFATPVTLLPQGAGRWRGQVAPLDDAMTLYLSIRLGADGRLEAFLRNPERNIGRYQPVDRVTLEGRAVKLLGRRSKEDPETTTAEGTYDGENDTLSIFVPSRGGTYDFRRATASDEASFYPRGKAPPGPYRYRPPEAEDDGWPVASLEDVGISREGIGRLVQTLIDLPVDSRQASDIHALLIARHGKLVLEEYFHGFHRHEPHDLRSAAKTLITLLTGAANRRGMPAGASTPVYETMEGAEAARGLDPRKRAMTVEHLLTMSSGLDCDDSDPSSPGAEDRMSEQTEQPDWYRFTLDLANVRAPGEKAVYCSINPNLAGGVLAKATGRWLPELFQELLAEPLQMRTYGLNLIPTGEAYMGGGARLKPRDFLKLAQVMLGGGLWKGRPIVSPEWARESAAPRYDLGTIRYGYLWWVIEYPYQGRTVRGFFAGGNGGQIALGVPELGLAVVFNGGNYGDRAGFRAQTEFIPQYVLPAVEQRKSERPKSAGYGSKLGAKMAALPKNSDVPSQNPRKFGSSRNVMAQPRPADSASR